MVFPKQGDPVDPSLGIEKGWWVDYPRVFLFVPPPDDEFTQITLESGEDSCGFNAVHMATQFGTSPSDLVTNNSIGAFTVREERGVLVLGADRAINFVFSLYPDGEIVAKVKIARIRGSA